MTGSEVYSSSFYEGEGKSAEESARAIVPLVLNLFSPRSVVDVGCGTGAFVREFIRNGVDDARGIDGDWLITGHHLVIPPSHFTSADIQSPIPTDRKYDLALCLEVGEHLESSRADTLVEELCTLAPVVVFSAATPLQFGTNHVNERWPSYWAKKFRQNGYIASDCLRPQVFHLPQVASWYATNMIAYIRGDNLSAFPPIVQQSAVQHVQFKVRNLKFPGYTSLANELPPPLRHMLYLTVRLTWGVVVDGGRSVTNDSV